jgi:hypothetical protein
LSSAKFPSAAALVCPSSCFWPTGPVTGFPKIVSPRGCPKPVQQLTPDSNSFNHWLNVNICPDGRAFCEVFATPYTFEQKLETVQAGGFLLIGQVWVGFGAKILLILRCFN